MKVVPLWSIVLALWKETEPGRVWNDDLLFGWGTYDTKRPQNE
ncbi:hypothetical protein [Bacillus weihaiensis]|nr:hypothetical protein [Bacillus weihaiensis]